MANTIDTWVYADWKGMAAPKCIGILSAQQTRGRKSFSFFYDKGWIQSEEQFLLDPDIAWYDDRQHPNDKGDFEVLMDSMPDTWGKTIMKRKAALITRGQAPANLHDIDFLLGVDDLTRKGALRFKRTVDGDFLDNDASSPVPPWTSLRELQFSAEVIESNIDTEVAKKWITMLAAPGASLGGDRPKANVSDENGHLWIAKFPSKNDLLDVGAWEYLAYRLAVNAGINMAESKIARIKGSYHTFFTKRFDRDRFERIHFASALTMTGNNEILIRDNRPSYLDMVEFIQFSGTNVSHDLHELWRRIIFNILISNTDDHLRNHGFILTAKGWRLSPAFDLNPSVNKDGLALNIDIANNMLDIKLAKSVGIYFRLEEKEMNAIIKEVKDSVADWQQIANEIGIQKSEQMQMSAAFRVK